MLANERERDIFIEDIQSLLDQYEKEELDAAPAKRHQLCGFDYLGTLIMKC